MNTTFPIRDYNDVQKFKDYFIQNHEYRNYMLVTFCLNTALRISDIIGIRWTDVLDNRGKINSHINIKEQKTGKNTCIFINSNIKHAIRLYMKRCGKNVYLFDNGMGGHISRSQAHRIISRGGRESGIGNGISCHSLRKTFGYHAWKNGISPALLTEIYNHSSYTVTKRYLGIIQEDKDMVFGSIML